MKRFFLLLTAVSLASAIMAAGTAAIDTRYDEAMRSYRVRDYPAAAAAFRSIVEQDEKDPLTLKSRYFLARSLMKNGSWRYAKKELVGIYETSPSFYAEWGCDFLLGECRKALGEEP